MPTPELTPLATIRDFFAAMRPTERLIEAMKLAEQCNEQQADPIAEMLKEFGDSEVVFRMIAIRKFITLVKTRSFTEFCCRLQIGSTGYQQAPDWAVILHDWNI